jgi:hypothetical protein
VATILGALTLVRRCRKGVSAATGGHNMAMAFLSLEASMIAYAIAAIFNSAERSTFFMLQFLIPSLLALHYLQANKLSTPAADAPTEGLTLASRR